MKEVVLYFGKESALAPVRRAMSVRKIALRAVPPQDYACSLAALAAGRADGAGYDGAVFDEPMLLFCSFSAARLDLALNGLRREGIAVPLKAVLTASNRDWTALALHGELAREHAALHEKSGGNRSQTSGY